MTGEVLLTVHYSDAGEGWFTAQVAEIPGAISEGRTREEARANVLDALQVLLTPDEDFSGSGTSGDRDKVVLRLAS